MCLKKEKVVGQNLSGDFHLMFEAVAKDIMQTLILILLHLFLVQ